MGVPVCRKHLRIEGRVQGVGFRAAAAETAQRLHLSGFVRNLPDGGVEAAVEGRPGDVAAFLAWCAHGSRPAAVTRLEAMDEAPEGPPDFRIEP